tara:strand:+ start:1219 stop:2025 length:807 start_codon:yes stop_codon:yes gene_type:complete
MNINDILKDVEVDVGMTRRMDCHFCGGKNTFTITNSMGSILFNCYKASCSVSGSRRVNLTVDQIKKSKSTSVTEKKFILPEYIVPIREDRFKEPKYGASLSLSWKEKIWKDYCLHDVKEDRAVFLIKDSQKGVVVDAIGAATDNRLPKWKRYGSSRHPFVAWNGKGGDGGDNSCVLVEDCYSACTAAKHGITGVALLGTNLLQGHKRFLCTNFDTVVVALDPDALQKTLQIRKELQSWVRTAKVLRLTDDLKYEEEIDINNMKEMIWN